MSRTRWLQVLLVVSLSLNLLVAGAMLGRLRDSQPPLGWAVERLDSDTRQALRPLLRERQNSIRQARRELHDIQVEIRGLMAQETLDKARLSELLASMREQGVVYQASLHETAVDMLAQLSPEQRGRVARRLLRPGAVPADLKLRDRRPPPPGEGPPRPR